MNLNYSFLQHIVFIMVYLIDIVIPDVPSQIKEAQRRVKNLKISLSFEIFENFFRKNIKSPKFWKEDIFPPRGPEA